MPKISVRNLQRKIPVNVVDLERFARKALDRCLVVSRNKNTDLNQAREVSVLIVSDRKMASLHRQFMNEAGPTDVMTFQHGEIFVSAETARHNARRFGNTFGSELRLYVVHGLLHLHGFDDREDAGARKMRSAQEKILAETAL
jgi:probable rRNA maturation factor